MPTQPSSKRWSRSSSVLRLRCTSVPVHSSASRTMGISAPHQTSINARSSFCSHASCSMRLLVIWYPRRRSCMAQRRLGSGISRWAAHDHELPAVTMRAAALRTGTG
eukprot:scaffold1147_cov68-Phaeocystis_antarctica.AAC.6